MSEQTQDLPWQTVQQKLDASFLQSEAWEKFQLELGLKVHKLHGKDWSCLLIERPTRLGNYLFAPWGPTVADVDALEPALAEIRAYGRKQGAAWVRLEPCRSLATDTEFGELLFNQKIKVVKAPKQVEPLFTRVVDLTPNPEELLAGISKTTRYIIRKNSGQNITFKASHDPTDMPLFIEMLNAVSDRNGANFHPKNYFLKQAQALMPDGQLWLEFALHAGKPVASIVMCGSGSTATYLYAASLPEARDLNASALLLWQAILNAKANDYTKLDLYGVAPENAPPDHPWQGFSSFKRKFGGTVIKRGETVDLPLKPTYHLYRLLRKARRLI